MRFRQILKKKTKSRGELGFNVEEKDAAGILLDRTKNDSLALSQI